MQAAQTIVYLNGTPFVEGQALIHQSCAGTFCHAASAEGAARGGAPHGLDFDVAPMTKGSTDADFAVFQAGITRIRDEAPEIWAIVENGEMPPGEAGDRPDLAWYSDAAGTTNAMLTGVDLAEARQKVRNWLACAAPVVAATTDSPQAAKVMSFNLGHVSEPGTNPIGPTFQSIYDNLLAGCGSCHGPGTPYANLGLNFATADNAFATLVGKPAFAGAGAACAGRTLVVPNDCQSSLLYQKLLPEGQATDVCGSPMPLGGTPPSEQVRQAVCDWITAGATR